VGLELGRYYLKEEFEHSREPKRSASTGQSRRTKENDAAGSVIIVIATDTPLDARNLQRMAARAIMGLARTGAAGSNGSGDYAIAFSTSSDVRIRTLLAPAARNATRVLKSLSNDEMSPLFLAVIEATEEAIYNSLFRATTTTGRGHTVEALPIERTIEILRKHRALGQ